MQRRAAGRSIAVRFVLDAAALAAAAADAMPPLDGRCCLPRSCSCAPAGDRRIIYRLSSLLREHCWVTAKVDGESLP